MKRRGKVLLFVAGIVVVGYATISMAKTSMFKSAIEQVSTSIGRQIVSDPGPTNLLLIGNNARDAKGPLSLGTAGGQADIMIVVHIDPKEHVLSLISIPRDTLFAMPNWNEPIPKIKTMFTLGLQQSPQDGPKLAMEAVSKFTGLPIQHYIVTDFQGFSDAINAVGGIQINVKQRLYDPEHSGADLNPGLQTLNGAQALAFIRIRQNAAGNDYRINDFQRQQAEMEMLDALKQKLLTPSTDIGRITQLADTWKKDVATDLPTQEMIGLGLESVGAKINRVTLGSVADSMDLADAPLQGVNTSNYLTGAYYDVLDTGQVAATLRPYGSTGSSTGLPPIPSTGDVPVTVYGSSVVAENLRHAGYTVTWAGPEATGSQVQVYYPPGKMPWGWVVARTLGTANEFVMPSTHDLASVVVYAP